MQYYLHTGSETLSVANKIIVLLTRIFLVFHYTQKMPSVINSEVKSIECIVSKTKLSS